MENVAIIIQARMGSSRFPGKVLENLGEKPVLQWVTDTCSKISLATKIIVATSDNSQDDVIEKWCSDNNITCFRASETDVLARFYLAAKAFSAKIIMRITADCPLIDPAIADEVLHLVCSGDADYASNISPPTWPDGLDCEAISFKTLEIAHKEAKSKYDREHVTCFVRANQHRFRCLNVTAPAPRLSEHRWTVDTQEDLAYLSTLVSACKGRVSTWRLIQVANLAKQPKLERNYGAQEERPGSLKNFPIFKNSQDLLARATKTIPLGSQTFSKSHIQYPENGSPLFVTHGQGSHVWDIDGNEYIDMVSGLLCNSLGYNDSDINHAIRRQLDNGISFSLATELESELAELICALVPSAEKVRFGKNGTDVTSAAVRLSRAFTGRDRVATCGYHGWQDWYIGSTTRNKGVPASVSALTTPLPYNDLNTIQKTLKTQEYACLIMEPFSLEAPGEGYLQSVKDICEKFGTLLVFDEVITGFRFALGGAQEYFGVKPHLTCLGKGMSNGMPLSAIAGRADIMAEMEEIFFSGTFGGETLSLAAGIATIQKLKDKNIIKKIWEYGDTLTEETNNIIATYDLGAFVKLKGLSPWKIFQFMDTKNYGSNILKTFFIQEMLARGVLINSSFNLCAAHTKEDLHMVLRVLDEVLCQLKEALSQNNLHTKLKGNPIAPLFKVR